MLYSLGSGICSGPARLDRGHFSRWATVITCLVTWHLIRENMVKLRLVQLVTGAHPWILAETAKIFPGAKDRTWCVLLIPVTGRTDGGSISSTVEICYSYRSLGVCRSLPPRTYLSALRFSTPFPWERSEKFQVTLLNPHA